MIPAFRTLDRESQAGEPLPSVWRTLEDAGIRWHRGELSLIAGPPGGGKSTMALQYARDSREPGVYVSCDMGPHMSSVKLGQIITGKPKAAVLAMPNLRELLQRETSHLWLAHEQGPTLGDLDSIVQAYLEIHSVYPPVVYVDNVMNVATSGDSQWTRDKKTCEVLHKMAGRYEIAVVALAHTFIKRGGRPWPASQDEIKGQISELPAVVVTVAADPQNGVMKLAAVKNRHGMPDPGAQNPLELLLDAPTGRLTDQSRRAKPGWDSNYYEKD